MRPRIRDTLEDFRRCIGYIAEDTAGLSFDDFMASRQLQQLVVHNFEIIGEALNRIRREEPVLVDQVSNPNQYIALRNVLIHGYDVIDYSIVWDIAKENLPDLAREIDRLLHTGADCSQ